MEDVRREMKKKAASVLVVTALDEVACKLLSCLGQPNYYDECGCRAI